LEKNQKNIEEEGNEISERDDGVAPALGGPERGIN